MARASSSPEVIRPQSALADLKKKEILAQAADMFDRAGYHSVSVEEIANAVGIRKPTVYHYFSSKDEILFELHDGLIDLLIKKAEARPQSMRASEALREIMTDVLELMHTNPGYLRVFFEHYRELPPDSQKTIRHKRDTYEQIVETTIERGIEEGEFRNLNPQLVVFAIFGICNWAYQWYRTDGPLGPRELGIFFSNLLFNGLKEQ